jgi:hypothetical protein
MLGEKKPALDGTGSETAMNQAKIFDFGSATRSLGLAVAFCAALSIIGCGSVVTGGGGGDRGAGGSGGSASSSSNGNGGNGSTTSSAIALLYSQFPPSGSSSSSTSSTSSGGGPDPNTLYIMLGDYALACEDPFETPCGNWHVSIGIPPALQVPSVISLSDPTVTSMYSASAPACESGSGGSFIDGTLEIVSISQTDVVGKLVNTSTFEFDANGDFTAVRCP